MAEVHHEAVLRQRVCLGQQCHAIFFICSHCDRGHRYCSTACREPHAGVSGGVPTGGTSRARKGDSIIATGSASTGAACAQTQPRVTDQGSLSIASPALFQRGPAEPQQSSFAATRLVAALPDLRPGRTLHRSVSTHSTTKVSPYHDHSGNPRRRFAAIFTPSIGRSAPLPAN